MSIRRAAGASDARSRGQALVEFAIVLPVILLLLVMAIDFGRAFFGWVGIQNAARIGANYAAAHPDAWTAPDTNQKVAQRAEYADQIMRDAGSINCAIQAIPNPVFTNVTGTANAREMGDHVTVTLACRFSVVTPIASRIVGSPVGLSADSTFAIRGGTVANIPLPVP